MLICFLTSFESLELKAAVRLGTVDAAIADAIDKGTLIRTLYLPVNTPHDLDVTETS